MKKSRPLFGKGGGELFSFVYIVLKWNHSRHQPPVAHFIVFALEVIDIFLDEMREPSLLEQVIANRQPFESAAGNLFALAIQFHLAVFDLVQRPNTGVDSQFTQLKGKHWIEIPALGARIQAVNEGRAAD